MIDCRGGAFADQSSSPVSIEECYAQPAFQFGKALRECGCADAHLLGCGRPCWCLGNGDEVFELTDRDIGKRAHELQNSSEMLHYLTNGSIITYYCAND